MAKIYTYGSSPTCSSYSLFNEWNPPEPFCNSEFGIVDPDPIELFEDLNEWPSSIFSDIKKIQSDTSASTSSCGDGGGLCLDIFEPELKPEIRNIDCMWSGQQLSPAFGAAATSPVASSPLTVGSATTAAVPLSSVIGNAQNISNNKQQQRQGAQTAAAKVEVKLEPSDSDFEQQLQQHSIPNSRSAQQQQQQQQQSQSLQHIKPGMSLLRKSNVQQQQQQQKRQQQQQKLSAIKIPAKTTTEFLRERDQMLSAASSNAKSVAFGRPDTPLSLDDDPIASEFKHSVDLRACVMGSNNISLVGGGNGNGNGSLSSNSSSDRNHIIQHLSQQLQDTSKNSIDLPSLLPEAPCDSRLLTDLLDVIVKDDPSHNSSSSSQAHASRGAANNNLSSRGFESDDEDDEEEDDDDYEEDDVGSSCGSASSTSQLDFQLSPSSTSSLNRSLSSSAASSSAASAYASATSPASNGGSSSSQPSYPMMLHSDHSYTRCNDDLGPNLETPSDSDEEIDVVSIGDKKLPTNPSDKDRRALQTKVAHKFSNAHIVKTANGVRTIPPRRRITVELPYTPASSSPVKSVANSRYPSPSATPYQNQYTSKYVQQQSQHMMSMLGEGGASAGEKQRKRVLPSAAGYVEYLPPGKKHRVSKKQKQHHGHSHGHGHSHSHGLGSSSSVSGDLVKRHYSLDEAADTIEKRNLHNDMERQRRIGLKNLFEALKKQIPSIRDKERAPKVNILREAAKLCEALTREDHQLSEQKALLKEQLRKRQELLARLRSTMQRD